MSNESSNEPRHPEMQALWNELSSLLPQGPSPRAEAILKELRERANQLEAASDPDAAEHLTSVCFFTGVLAANSGDAAGEEAAFREGIGHARRAVEDRKSTRLN